jgi:DNA-binding GntR family transcriptional regulator
MELAQYSVKNLLVEQIRNEIIQGHYVPGQRLRLRDLAAEFQVSTQPVRDALVELEAEGLVTSEPRRGAVVTVLSPAELQDIYDIRSTLESMATRLAVPLLSEEIIHDLDQLADEIDRHMGQILELVRLNFEFHTTLYEASGRTHLCELIETLRHRTEHYLHAYIIDLGGMTPAQEEHRAIIDACRNGDAEIAAEIMHSHVAKAGQEIIEYAERTSENDALHAL